MLFHKDNASFYIYFLFRLFLYLIWNFCFTIFNWLLLQYIISCHLSMFFFQLNSDNIATKFNCFFFLLIFSHTTTNWAIVLSFHVIGPKWQRYFITWGLSKNSWIGNQPIMWQNCSFLLYGLKWWSRKFQTIYASFGQI